MHDYFNDLKPAGFSFLTENQLKEVESKGTLAKPFIMKRAKINMYNFIDSFFLSHNLILLIYIGKNSAF